MLLVHSVHQTTAVIRCLAALCLPHIVSHFQSLHWFKDRDLAIISAFWLDFPVIIFCFHFCWSSTQIYLLPRTAVLVSAGVELTVFPVAHTLLCF